MNIKKTLLSIHFWQMVIDILGKVAVPVVLGYMTWVISDAQRELSIDQEKRQGKEIAANKDLKLLEVFYREIVSRDQERRDMAVRLVQIYCSPTLLKALATVSPALAVHTAVDAVADRTISDEIRSEIERGRRDLVEEFVILNPTDGEAVNRELAVKATTPFHMGLKYYIVVTPLKTGTDYNECEPKLNDSMLEGQVRLGSVGAGGGEKFSIRIIGTKTTIPQGPLLKTPADAINTNTVTVTRKD